MGGRAVSPEAAEAQMKLPAVSGHEVIAALERSGFQRVRQKGSHVFMMKREPEFLGITVPLHREVAKGTLRAILRNTRIDLETFRSLLSG